MPLQGENQQDKNAIAGDAPALLPAPLLIVEDERLMQERLRAILLALGYADEALFVAQNMAQARVMRAQQPFALALIDIHLPDGSGIDLIREWHEADPSLTMLVVSAWSVSALIVSAIQAGATGYLLKQRDDAEITLSLRSALSGGAPIDPFVARHILSALSREGGPAATPEAGGGLAPREFEILSLVSRGLTNKGIAELLCLSNATIGWHTKNIYKKLAVSTRTQAVFAARSRGWLP